MLYLLYGLEEFLMEKEIKKLIQKNKIEPIMINTYDLENSTINEIVEDASTLSLFGEKKLIRVMNSYLFTGTNNKKLSEQDPKALEDYIKNPNPNTILVFEIVKEGIDSRKKITSLMKKEGTVLEFNKVENVEPYVLKMLEPYQLEKQDLKFLIDRVGKNLDILNQEIQKLKTYQADDLMITKDTIIEVTCKTVDIDIFHLIDNIVSQNKEQAIESYHEMLKLGEEPIKIIIMLANQFRMMYQAKCLSKMGYTEKDIASELEVHPYRIKLSLIKSRSFKEQTLLNYLKNLAELDQGIKSGIMDKNIGLELFILQI